MKVAKAIILRETNEAESSGCIGDEFWAIEPANMSRRPEMFGSPSVMREAKTIAATIECRYSPRRAYFAEVGDIVEPAAFFRINLLRCPSSVFVLSGLELDRHFGAIYALMQNLYRMPAQFRPVVVFGVNVGAHESIVPAIREHFEVIEPADAVGCIQSARNRAALIAEALHVTITENVDNEHMGEVSDNLADHYDRMYAELEACGRVINTESARIESLEWRRKTAH